MIEGLLSETRRASGPGPYEIALLYFTDGYSLDAGLFTDMLRKIPADSSEIVVVAILVRPGDNGSEGAFLAMQQALQEQRRTGPPPRWKLFRISAEAAAPAMAAGSICTALFS